MAAKQALKYFTPDGFRGLEIKSNERMSLMPDLALRLGYAGGIKYRNGGHNKVVIGKATMLHGYGIEPALTSGFVAAGMDVHILGPLPVAGVAMLARSMRASLGVMISVADRPYDQVGIKLFGKDGAVISSEIKVEIEAMLDTNMSGFLAESPKWGRAKRIEGSRDRYVEYAKQTLPKGLTFDGLRIAIDCANGAAYEVVPWALEELNAEVFAIGVKPDGTNINHDYGSGSLGSLSDKVREVRADAGVAFDGDGSHIVVVDENRRVIGTDDLGAILKKGRQEFFKPAEENDSTGDGLVTALQALAVMKSSGLKLSDLVKKLKP